VAAIRKNLNLHLALQRFQGLAEPRRRIAERGSPRDQALERAQPRGAGDFPTCCPGQMTQLGGDARQHRAAQRVILIASDDLVELRDPSEDPGGQNVGPPHDAMPRGVLAQPALHQIGGRVARGPARGGEVGDPAKAMPGGDPFRPGRGGEPTWGRMADQLSAKLDLAAGDRRATFGVAWPAQSDAHPQVVRNPADQRVTIKRPGGERLKRVAAQPRQQPGSIAAQMPADGSN